MLSVFGRTAVRSYPHSSQAFSYRVESVSLLCLRVSAAITGPSITHNSSCMSLQRNYATKPVSRPKAHTGRTTRSPRNANSTTKSESTRASSDDTVLEKTKPKIKANVKSKSRPKTKAKPRTKAKAKAKSRPKKTRVAKKPQTEEQKVAAAQKAKRKKILILKKDALRPPTRPASSAWQAILNEKLSSKRGASLIDLVKEASREYKNLTPEGREVC